MPIDVLGYSFFSKQKGDKNDTSLFVKKSNLRIDYIESKIEENIDCKNQLRIRNSSNPKTISEAVSKDYVDNKHNDPFSIKSTASIDFKDRNLDKFVLLK